MVNNYYYLAVLLAFQAPCICLIVCTYVFFALRRNGLTRKQYLLLKALAIGTFLLALCEVLTGAISYNLFDWNVRYIRVCANSAYICTLFNTVVLSEYCLSKINKKSNFLVNCLRVMYFLTAGILIFRFLSFGTKLFLYFGPNEELMYGPLDDIQSWACLAIDVFLLVIVLYNFFDKEEYVNKESNQKLVFSVFFIGFIQLIYLLTYIPYIVWMSYMIVIVYLYIIVQELLVYTDELTTLKNRRRMLIDINELQHNNKKWSFIMCDINSFKQVNDIYGHNEGDRALRIVSRILDEVSTSNDFEAYRLGGDEFALVLTDDNIYRTNEIIEEINSKLSDYNKIGDIPYEISISYGQSIVGENSIDVVQDIIDLADQRMYENKKEYKKKK